MRKLETIYKAIKWNRADERSRTELTSKNNKDSRTFCLLPGETTLNALKRVFSIQDCVFDYKFGQACSGSGQEERRIAVLHSSSLCALLFFYNITVEHPLELYVEGIGTVRFADSIFEYQNCVIEGANPSNIDVTLLGECNGKRVILFLESKFSEYITGTQSMLRVKRAYLQEELSQSIYENWQWDKDIISEESEFSVSISGKEAYLGGLKQMISHYVGVRKFERGIAKLKCKQDAGKDFCYIANSVEKQEIQEKVRKFALEGDVTIALGSIVFDIYENDKEHSELQNYEELYTKLMEQIAEDAVKCNSKLVILTKAYTYQEVFKDRRAWIPKEIYQFYFGE